MFFKFFLCVVVTDMRRADTNFFFMMQLGTKSGSKI